MALEMKKVGKTTGPFRHSYTEKDMIIYGLGIGAGRDELEYVYEKGLKTIPCYGAILVNDPEVVEKSWRCGFDRSGTVQWGFDLEILGSMKPQGTLVSYSTFQHLYDRGVDKGALTDVEVKTYDEEGNLLFINHAAELGKKDGGFGGEKPPVVRVDFPDRPADYTCPDTIADNQALLYRLTGDVFELHVDPDFYSRIGYDKPVLHGMCTAGFACRHIIRTFIPHEPERLKRFKVRFTNPVFVGDLIRTDIWEMEGNQCHFRTVNVATNKSVLDYGVACWK